VKQSPAAAPDCGAPKLLTQAPERGMRSQSHSPFRCCYNHETCKRLLIPGAMPDATNTAISYFTANITKSMLFRQHFNKKFEIFKTLLTINRK
jgi:hypothetical protein